MSAPSYKANFCPVCLGSICTTCGHPTPMHRQYEPDGERFCTINTPEGCDCKADPRQLVEEDQP